MLDEQLHRFIDLKHHVLPELGGIRIEHRIVTLDRAQSEFVFVDERDPTHGGVGPWNVGLRCASVYINSHARAPSCLLPDWILGSHPDATGGKAGFV